MKIFFDTNVYVADAIGGQAARTMIDATLQQRWRIYSSNYVVKETAHVLVDYFGFSPRLAYLIGRKIRRHAILIEGQTKAIVPQNPKDNPILQAALLAGADYLVANDKHLMELDPYESLRIVSMKAYHQILKELGTL
jgi:putative PIN family toxin of toxin-antitoxin system